MRFRGAELCVQGGEWSVCTGRSQESACHKDGEGESWTLVSDIVPPVSGPGGLSFLSWRFLGWHVVNTIFPESESGSCNKKNL